MDLTSRYKLDFEKGWRKNYDKMDRQLQERVWKKIQQLKQPLKHRHLKHGLPFFVEEVSGYRIVFKVIKEEKTKKIFFVGDHKQYEKWFSSS